MNNKNSVMIGEVFSSNNQQTFQWEAPVLYTEDWLKTFGGGDTDLVENGFYHT